MTPTEEFAAWLAPASPQEAAGRDLQVFLTDQRARGLHPNTLRKLRSAIRCYYKEEYAAGRVSAETLLSIRAVPPPRGSTRYAHPQQYRRDELKALRATLDDRWPLLPADEQARWLRRFREGISPYERVRSHAIRMQLEAVIALALRCALRRGEVFALDVNAMHHDNAHAVVRGRDGPWGQDVRTVIYTDSSRAPIQAWLEMRARLGPDDDRPWLNLWSERTFREPMARIPSTGFCGPT